MTLSHGQKVSQDNHGQRSVKKGSQWSLKYQHVLFDTKWHFLSDKPLFVEYINLQS